MTGFVADTTEAAKAALYPGWLQAFTQVGKERGWPPVTRAQFEASFGPAGPYLIGDPQTVIDKALNASRIQGGVSRLSFQMSAANAGLAVMKRSIELVGTHVARGLRRQQLVEGLS